METDEYIIKWLKGERDYTIGKFGLESDDLHVQQFNSKEIEYVPEWWDQQFKNYLHRAKLLGLENPNGRQALAKFVATAVGMLEAAVRVYGPLPEPGVPSGYNLDKVFDPDGTQTPTS